MSRLFNTPQEVADALPEEISQNFLANYDPEYAYACDAFPAKELSHAIRWAFDWERSYNGTTYWENVFVRAFAGEFDPKGEEKELANWIYYEDENFYCFPCVEKRMEEINANKEFADEIDFENGDTCGYMQDYADVDYHVECCKCGKPLFSKVDCNKEPKGVFVDIKVNSELPTQAIQWNGQDMKYAIETLEIEQEHCKSGYKEDEKFKGEYSLRVLQLTRAIKLLRNEKTADMPSLDGIKNQVAKEAGYSYGWMDMLSKVNEHAVNRHWEDVYRRASAHERQRAERAEVEAERLSEVLKKIANPIQYLRENAEKEGSKLNGFYAAQLSNDANWLKEMAKSALAEKGGSDASNG